MPIGRNKFRKSIGRLDIVKQDAQTEIPAILGVTLGGEYLVEVPDRDGFVYARIRSNLSELVQAYNDQVSPVYGLPVIIIRDSVDKNRFRVKGKDLGRYQVWGTNAYLPKHGGQHSFDPDQPGADPVWVFGRQMMPLAALPSGTSGGPNVRIEEAIYWQNQWIYAGGTGTADIIGYKPTGSTARMVLVYMDGDGNPQIEPGTSYFDATYTGTAQIVPYLPNLPETSGIPVAGIRLVSGTSAIAWSNIYDVRPWIVGDGFIPTGSVGHTIQDDGTPLAQRPNLNFVGTGFSLWDSGSSTIVSGTSSGIIGGYDNNAVLFATSDGNGINTFPTFNVYEGEYFSTYNNPSVVIGATGTTLTYGYLLSLISDYSVPARADFAYGMPVTHDYYYAGGTLTSPTQTTKDSALHESDIHGYDDASSWNRATSFHVEALENFTNSPARSPVKLRWEIQTTGSSTWVQSLELYGQWARFGGDISFPTGSSLNPDPSLYFGNPNYTSFVYPDGTWRTTRSGDNLVFQKKESGSWNEKHVVSSQQAIFTVYDEVSVASIPFVLTNLTGADRTITKAHLRVSTAPTDADLIVDIHKEGTTIFTTQSNRPTISAGSTSGYTTSIDVSTWGVDEEITAHVDQIGSGTSGSNLVITMVYS